MYYNMQMSVKCYSRKFFDFILFILDNTGWLYRKLDYPEYIKQSPKLHDFCEKIRDNILM